MPVTDSVADMLTRIRNGLIAKHDMVDVPASNMKKAIGQILLEEGYIKGCEFIDDGVQGTLRIKLKYGPNGEKVITGLKKISKPGLRVYARHDKLPQRFERTWYRYYLYVERYYHGRAGAPRSRWRRSDRLHLVSGRKKTCQE